jgi:hypothetical protein
VLGILQPKEQETARAIFGTIGELLIALTAEA